MAEIKYLDLTGLQRYDQKIKEVINTGLDTKIGKDDAMLYGTREPASTNWYVVSNWPGEDPDGKQPLPYVIGDSWKMETSSSAPLMLCDSDGNLIYDLPERILSPDGDYYGADFHIITHNNGSLTIDSIAMDVANQEVQLEIDPNKAYILKLKNSDAFYNVPVGVEGDVIAQTYNTQESLKYLNENKADKTDLEELDLGVKSLKIGGNTLKGNVELAYDQVYDHWMQKELDSGDVYFKTVQRSADAGASNELIDIVAGKVVGFDNKANTWDIPTEVSQLTNDAGYAVAGDLKIAEVTEGLGENVAKAYKFEGGAESAVIEIPKDQTLKSVELGKIVDEAFVADPTGEILRFTYIIADGSEKVVDVNISNLITEAELDPVYDLIDTKLNAADVLTVSNDEIDAMFA